jgi:hypothetical protein
VKTVIIAAATIILGAGAAFAQSVPTPAAQGRMDTMQRPAVEGKATSTTRMNATTPDEMQTTGRVSKSKKKKSHR